MNKLFLAASLGAGLTYLTVPTQSPAQPDDRTSISVSKADLDLTTAVGQKTLERRITQAINKACPADWVSQAQRDCKAAARAALQTQQPAPTDR